jgi:hypothetical protein
MSQSWRELAKENAREVRQAFRLLCQEICPVPSPVFLARRPFPYPAREGRLPVKAALTGVAMAQFADFCVARRAQGHAGEAGGSGLAERGLLHAFAVSAQHGQKGAHVAP